MPNTIVEDRRILLQGNGTKFMWEKSLQNFFIQLIFLHTKFVKKAKILSPMTELIIKAT